MKYVIIFALFLHTTLHSALGYETSSLFSSDYWESYIKDTQTFITAPARWEHSEWRSFGLVCLSGSALFYADEIIRENIQKKKSTQATIFFTFADHAGDGTYTLPLLALLYTGGYYSQNTSMITAALTGLESFVLANITTQSLKILLQRHRPYSNDGSNTWDGPSLTAQYKAFPSGHTTAAFSIAAALAGTWDTPAAYISCYTLALSTGLARIYFDKHWSSDVFVGALIGSITGHTLALRHKIQPDIRPRISYVQNKINIIIPF